MSSWKKDIWEWNFEWMREWFEWEANQLANLKEQIVTKIPNNGTNDLWV